MQLHYMPSQIYNTDTKTKYQLKNKTKIEKFPHPIMEQFHYQQYFLNTWVMSETAVS